MKLLSQCRLGLHGAARLVYGQNPVLPNTTTASTSAATTTKSTTTTTTTTTPLPPAADPEVASKDDSDESDNDSDVSAEPVEPVEPIETGADAVETMDKVDPPPAENSDVAEEAANQPPPAVTEVTEAAPGVPEVPITVATTQATPPPVYTYRPYRTTKKPKYQEEPERQLIGDVIVEDEAALRKSTSRRSVTHMAPKVFMIPIPNSVRVPPTKIYTYIYLLLHISNQNQTN